MGLFTGTPQPGYLGVIEFNGVTLPCDVFDYDSNMNWQDATIFNPNGLADHSKGISQGVLNANGIWDTGLNVQSGMPLGAQDALVYKLNSSDHGTCAQAKLMRFRVHDEAKGQGRWDATWIIDGSWTDFSGATANSP